MRRLLNARARRRCFSSSSRSRLPPTSPATTAAIPEAENRDAGASSRHLEARWASAVAWPNGFDEWFQDHFGFRSTLVRLVRASRVLRTARVAVGPGRRAATTAGCSTPTMAGWTTTRTKIRCRPARSTTGAQTIIRARDWCRAHGIAYVFTIRARQARDLPGVLPTTPSTSCAGFTGRSGLHGDC